MPKAKKSSTATALDFTFFQALRSFYAAHSGTIRNHYRDLTKRFLDFNNPEKNPKAFLRKPQFEALEVYVFLKEFLGNDTVANIFKDWYEKQNKFSGREEGGVSYNTGQTSFIDNLTIDQYKDVLARMDQSARAYPNYIFALTMGTGKTILMATCIFYEFILANKFPKERHYCHNALVFAPDTTVLQSLREIESFDLARVVPAEYVNFLRSHLRFHYLVEAGTSLDCLDESMFNVVVSNTQKIILRRRHTEDGPVSRMFQADLAYEPGSVYDAASDLYGIARPGDEQELTTNQRFQKLQRLKQLGIYVDEAHHAFGKDLARDTGSALDNRSTSLRLTIDELAASLERAGTHVVACYNYTGTPYVGAVVLPEVVYAYGLNEAISNRYLKRVKLHGYTNPRTGEFVNQAVDGFLKAIGTKRPEGMLPKLAFFAATIEELQQELRPAVEAALEERGIPTSRILVNVGDLKLTSNDDIREFNRLDTPGSEKQFILLVNKGREGWNCRSLFGVALFREPRSKVFVLQATMRCLRSIGNDHEEGQVFLTHKNLTILNDELQQNFRMNTESLQKAGDDKETYEVRVKVPPVKVKLRRVRKRFEQHEKPFADGYSLGLQMEDPIKWAELTQPYRLLHITQEGLDPSASALSRIQRTQDITAIRKKVAYSELMLVGEVARYLNLSPLRVEGLLRRSAEGLPGVLGAVNEFNELLYEVAIPNLFRQLYEITFSDEMEDFEVELIKQPPPGSGGFYTVRADPAKVVRDTDPEVGADRVKSFHLDTYAFDSNPEQTLFWDLLRDGRVTQIFFTGMLTHGQTDFFVQYVDPDSHLIRSYYPDFLVHREDGTYIIVEVKGDHQVDTRVVNAKAEYAKQLAAASGMEYRMIKGTSAAGHYYEGVLG